MCTWILVSDTKDDKHEALASAGAKSQPIFVPGLLECFPSFRCDGMAYEVRGKRWQCAGSRSCKSNRFTSLAKNTPSSLRRVRSSRRGGGARLSRNPRPQAAAPPASGMQETSIMVEFSLLQWELLSTTRLDTTTA